MDYPAQLDFSDQFVHAYNLLEKTQKNVFITGKAGTGKSTLLKYFRDNTQKNIVLLAPTGVAAVNVKGQTIHSFFRFKPDVTIESVGSIRMRKRQKELYKNLQTLIIDEISMVRADLIDCVDTFLQKHGPYPGEPFGGIQMIFIGDLYQLPPVVTTHDKEFFTQMYPSPFFFDAKVFGRYNMEFIDLEKIYRQQDDTFINLLNAIRKNRVTPEQMSFLNKRVDPHFVPKDDDMYVYLTTTNALADGINKNRLNRLATRSHSVDGGVEGDFGLRNLPTQETLDIKVGAQVMLLNNDAEGRWVNGSIGQIADILPESETVYVALDSGETVAVQPFTWEMFRFKYNEEEKKVESSVVGTFTQFPLKLAWAMTIHKSQGKTFSKVIIDMGWGAFSHGQTYVALSRCTSLEGLSLRRPILPRHIMLDQRVIDFMDKIQSLHS